MIDLHCHILPGLDDGADSLDTACRMAAMAADSGLGAIVTTPHCNLGGDRNHYRSAGLTRARERLQAELDRWRIPIRLLPGAEVLLRSNPEPLLEAGLLPTLNDSRYLLVEFYFDAEPAFIERQLERVEAHGLVPVIAHPERYLCVQDDPTLADRWADRGRILQLNKGSLLGSLGAGAFDTANLLLRRELADVIATDAHHYRHRTPRLDRLLQVLEQFHPAADPDLLLRRNPLAIIRNETLR